MAKVKKLKLKTHKGASKRFKVKANGQIKHRSAYKNHILTKKDAKRKRQLRGLQEVSKSDVDSVKQLLKIG